MKPAMHVTIGIPVYNEEANIGNLLKALVNQTHKQYILDRIVVASDGSTDTTGHIVKALSKKYSCIVWMGDTNRLGVAYRIAQLTRINKSDVLIFLDGDTLPRGANMLDSLVSVFTQAEVQLATATLTPLPPTTLFERFLYNWRKLWGAITYSWRDGNNIYNFRGIGIAIRREFAKSITTFDKTTGASSHLMYLSAIHKGYKTAVSHDAEIYYRLPTNLSDYLRQVNRGQSDNRYLKNTFSSIYHQQFDIPKTHKYFIIIRHMLYNPIGVIMGLALQLIVPLVNSNPNPSDTKGVWEPVKSTKSALTTIS
jgi:glycosyltransferase involved in cell wall biosynthesis